MASNPMQRRAKLYFLLGVVLTLLVAAVGIFFLYKQNQKIQTELDKQLSLVKKGYVLNKDIDAGEVITSDMLTEVDVMGATVPSDYTDINTIMEQISEKNGEQNKEIVIKSKISLKANTMLTAGMLTSDSIKNDLREQTYNMIALPIDLDTGEYVDIRLMLPNGQDYIVLSKIKVTIPDAGGTPLADTIKINVTEGELLTLSSAIVEAYEIEGSKLYAIKYTDADMQAEAAITYVPKAEVLELVQEDPNVVAEAERKLKDRWNDTARDNRNTYINKAQRSEEGAGSKIQESTEATQQAREEYLTSLYGGTASSGTSSSTSQ